TNDDITDLYGRVQVGTRVVVLPGKQPDSVQATTTNGRPTESAPRPRPKAATTEKPAAPPPNPPPRAASPPAAPAQATPAPAPAAKGEAGGKDTTGAIPAPAAELWAE